MRIDLEVSSPLGEKEGSIFIAHADQAGAAGSSVEPQDEGVVVGVTLRIKEHIVECGSIEIKHAWIGREIPEYHLWSVQPLMGILTQSSAGTAKAKATRAKINRYFIKDLQSIICTHWILLIALAGWWACLGLGDNKINKMKRQRNIPVLNEVMERQNEYETHLVKLQKIQADRKFSLARKSLFEKTILLEHIKNQKHHNFIQKLSKESMKINEENIKFVDKLHRATVSVSSRSKRSSLSQSSLTCSLKKSKDREITKENSRIFNKLNNSCPYVNTQKINEQYQKIKKIGNRLRKYDQSCELKTKKYMRTSTLSVTGNLRFSAPHKLRDKKSLKPKLAQFYNKEDILKNKIESRGIPSAKVLLRELQNRKLTSEQKYYEFFNTQVNPETHF